MIDSISGIVGSQANGAAAPPSGNVEASSGAGEDFGQILGRLATDALDIVKTGEAAAIQGLKAEMSPLAVVNSVMAAQQSLHAVLAIRDKAVAAYQEIARMTI